MVSSHIQNMYLDGSLTHQQTGLYKKSGKPDIVVLIQLHSTFLKI